MYNQTVARLYGASPEIHDLAKLPYRLDERLKELFPDQFKSATEVGIEVEIEGHNTPIIDSSRWRTEEDTSLRGGIELITYPLRDHQICEALAGLDEYFSFNPNAKFSHRCSVHVHLNCSNLTYEQLMVLVGFYLTVENIFFKEFFPDRKGNSYCFPLSNTMLSKDDFKIQRLNRDTWKYAALNAYHLQDYGTLEFRHHCGTKNVKELFAWVNTLLNIYQFALNTKIDAFKSMLEDINTSSGYTEYVRQALPDWRAPIEASNMYDSVTAAKYFIFND